MEDCGNLGDKADGDLDFKKRDRIDGVFEVRIYFVSFSSFSVSFLFSYLSFFIPSTYKKTLKL